MFLLTLTMLIFVRIAYESYEFHRLQHLNCNSFS